MADLTYIKRARRHRATGALIEVHDTSSPGYPGSTSIKGKWRVMCVTHDERSPFESNVAESNRQASSPWGWCSKCRALNPDAPVKGQKIRRPAS